MKGTFIALTDEKRFEKLNNPGVPILEVKLTYSDGVGTLQIIFLLSV